MKSRRLISALGCTAAALLCACNATVYSSASSSTDDLYATHDRKALAQQRLEQQARRLEAEKAALEAEEARQRRVAEEIARLHEKDRGDEYDGTQGESYEDSYERRLRGFSPSSRTAQSETGASMRYASAYDPAFYDVTVAGDQIWVEPRYVTSMFGNWGGGLSFGIGSWGWGFSTSPFYGWGWNTPAWGWNWGYPYYNYAWNWSPYWGWNAPYYGWGPYWHYPYWGWGGYFPHHHWGDWHPRYNSRNTVYNRPRTGSGSSYRPSYRGDSHGSSSFGGGNGGSYRRGSSYSPSSGVSNGRPGSRYEPNATTTSPSRPERSYRRSSPAGSVSIGGGSSNGSSSGNRGSSYSPNRNNNSGGNASGAVNRGGSYNNGGGIGGGGSFGGGASSGGGTSRGGGYRR